jgi:hypothetical protein
VRGSCVTDACWEEFTPVRGSPPVRLVLIQAEEWTGETVYRVDGRALYSVPAVLDRLSLYPRTVSVAWQAESSHSESRGAALHAALASAAAKRGVRVLAQPPPPAR